MPGCKFVVARASATAIFFFRQETNERMPYVSNLFKLHCSFLIIWRILSTAVKEFNGLTYSLSYLWVFDERLLFLFEFTHIVEKFRIVGNYGLLSLVSSRQQ